MTTGHHHRFRTPVLTPVRARLLRRATAAGVVLGALALAGVAPALAAPPVAGPTAAAVGAPASAPDRASASAPAPATLTVTGTGRAGAAPDIAVISVAVEARAKTGEEAMAAQSRAAEALFAALRKQSVADRDIRTESISLFPVYSQATNGESKVSGYQASQSVSATVRDVDRTGQVVGAVTKATGDAGRVDGVTFDVADPAALRSRARELAHKDAHDKAAQHARLSGHRLGRLVSLTETDSGRPGTGSAPEASADASGVPLAPGEIEEQVTVTAVYELL
ncbi:SIMPL domain-containing protein [Streptomyces sp. NPDC013457]|uniref:SIMPL domain-containing protein n=1 Tax=Streptomyces sp. NPDC013457 TaxID=3364866 RepID=UPI0036FB46DD